jgi:hypothetical protein
MELRAGLDIVCRRPETLQNPPARLCRPRPYRSASVTSLDTWILIRDRIGRYPGFCMPCKITEEANFTDGPSFIDSSYPNVCLALTEES